MKPIAIIQNSRNDGPAQFEVFARENGLPIQLFRMFAKDPLPRSVTPFSGVCILGSPRSVNDDFPPLRQMESLVLEARRERVPVIGHCFGGQMLAKALGGSVSPAPNAEIGWSSIQARTTQWFGAQTFPMFQWHFETFTLPPQATALASSAHCENQAFCVDDIHLAMQFHCEVDEAKIESWLDAEGVAEISANRSKGIQHPEEIRWLIPTLINQSKQVAHHIYCVWARALRS